MTVNDPIVPVAHDVTSESVKKPPKWLMVAKLCVSIALVGYILSEVEFGEILSVFSTTRLSYFAVAVVLLFVGVVFMSWRLQLLLRARGIDIPFGVLYRSCLVASFFRQFLPSTVGGDAIRMYDVWKAGASKTLAVTSLVVDRLSGLLAIASIAVIAVFFSGDLTSRFPFLYFWVPLGALFLFAVAGIIIWPSSLLIQLVEGIIRCLPKRFQGVFRKLINAATAYRHSHYAILKAVLISVLFQVNVVGIYYMNAMALNLEISFQHFFIIVPIAVIVMMVPITINGIGLRESAFIVLLTTYGATHSEAVACAWLEYALSLLFGLVGASVYVFRR